MKNYLYVTIVTAFLVQGCLETSDNSPSQAKIAAVEQRPNSAPITQAAFQEVSSKAIEAAEYSFSSESITLVEDGLYLEWTPQKGKNEVSQERLPSQSWIKFAEEQGLDLATPLSDGTLLNLNQQTLAPACYHFALGLDSDYFFYAPASSTEFWSVVNSIPFALDILAAGRLCLNDKGILDYFDNLSPFGLPTISNTNFAVFLAKRGLEQKEELALFRSLFSRKSNPYKVQNVTYTRTATLAPPPRIHPAEVKLAKKQQQEADYLIDKILKDESIIKKWSDPSGKEAFEVLQADLRRQIEWIMTQEHKLQPVEIRTSYGRATHTYTIILKPKQKK